MAREHESPAPTVAVFSPSPMLTVTIERGHDAGRPEVHLHPGGQGVWVSRMASIRGAQVTLCAPLTGPHFEPVDPSGAGDSMYAALGVGIAAGLPVREALPIGLAAGALNATRRGLGTGGQEEIELVASAITVRELEIGARTSR